MRVQAEVAELADAQGSGPCSLNGSGGSSPLFGTQVASMGLIHVTVKLCQSQQSRRKYEADFLVDTGATDCKAPASKLQRAGIRRRGRMTYELANGAAVEYDFGL